MRLVKIKNKYLFQSNKPHGNHTYAVYYDRKNKEYRAIGLTHLYVKDKKRFIQVAKGNIHVEKFKEFDTPTGVKNSYFNRNIKGNKINLKDKDIISVTKRHLSKVQSNRIKAFAKRKEK